MTDRALFWVWPAISILAASWWHLPGLSLAALAAGTAHAVWRGRSDRLVVLIFAALLTPAHGAIAPFLTLGRGAWLLALVGGAFLGRWRAIRPGPTMAAAVAVLVTTAISWVAAEPAPNGTALLVSLVGLVLLSETVAALLPAERGTECLQDCGVLLLGATIGFLPDGSLARESEALSSGWDVRAYGPFSHPNDWALALVVAGAPALAAFSAGREPQWRIAKLLGIAAFPAAVLQTMSRGAILVELGVLGAFAVVDRRSWRDWVAGMALFVPFLLVFVDLSGVLARVVSLVQPKSEYALGHRSLVQRVRVWPGAWAVVREDPLTGCGLGNFAVVVQRHTGRLAVPANNTLLTAVTEQGVPGLLSHLALLGTALWTASQALRRVPGPLSAAVAIAAVAAAASALTNDLLTTPLVWFGLGVLAAQARGQRAG